MQACTVAPGRSRVGRTGGVVCTKHQEVGLRGRGTRRAYDGVMVVVVSAKEGGRLGTRLYTLGTRRLAEVRRPRREANRSPAVSPQRPVGSV